MWLDRFAGGAHSSGPSTPQPGSRPYSPLPRRTSSTLSPYVTSQRAGHSPRASSLSLVSNDSSASLLSSSRRPNGSGLRRPTISENESNPSEALDKLLRQISDEGDTKKPTTGITEADLEIAVDFGSLSLKDYAASPHSDGNSPDDDDYEDKAAKFEELHRSITACDEVLNSVESNLANFQSDLAAVSADIESLQERSSALNKRLENRIKVEKALGPLVEDLSLSPEIVSKIVDGHIDESWTKTLNELDRRTVAHRNRTSDIQNKASNDLGPLLEKLTQKAVERIRDFLVSQIKALRSPNINAQIIQQRNFVRFKDLYTFLHKHHAVLAEEISLAYMNTMRWYYSTQFTRYEKALSKIKLHDLDKNDVLGHEEASRKATVLSGSRLAYHPHDAFSLGRRIDVLRTSNQNALSSYLAEEDQSMHYLEVPFRNFNLALVDNATAEYTFLAAFFSPALSFSQISKNFNYIFESTFALGQMFSKTLASESYDALGLLICIRLNQHFAFELQRRKVPAMDGYINGTNMLLWPRFQVIMDRHCDSVHHLTNGLPAKHARMNGDQSKLPTAPHVVTQRFGQLLGGFLELSTEAGDDEPVVSSLRRLRSDVEAFLTRFSQAYTSDGRRSERFLYNNYSLILTIISDITGKLAVEQLEHFEGLKAAYRGDS